MPSRNDSSILGTLHWDFALNSLGEEPASLLIAKVLFSTQQSLADDQVKMSFMDCCVLQLLSLHSWRRGRGRVTLFTLFTLFYLLGFIRGVENRCLTSVLGHF